MCLYIGNPVALKATKDITVYKYVEQHSYGYVTPCRNADVELNDTLKPNSETDIKVFFRKYCIGGGAIHACLSTIDSGFNCTCTCLKAIIKKGTTYYVQDDLTQVAAKELYITDEVVTEKITTPDFNCILEDYLSDVMNDKSFANKDGVKVGYYALSDKTFVSPLEGFDHSIAIGIVAFFDKNNEPVVVSIDEELLPWLTEFNMKNKVCSDIGYPENDFDGKKHTYDIVASKDYDPDKFKSVAYCANYKTNGTERGDWYLGSVGEMINVAKNVAIINLSIFYTGVGTYLKMKPVWTSSERRGGGISYALDCNLGSGSCHDYYYWRNEVTYVRPLYAFNKGVKA
jgi:hypothetical protein